MWSDPQGGRCPSRVGSIWPSVGIGARPVDLDGGDAPTCSQKLDILALERAAAWTPRRGCPPLSGKLTQIRQRASVTNCCKTYLPGLNNINITFATITLSNPHYQHIHISNSAINGAYLSRRWAQLFNIRGNSVRNCRILDEELLIGSTTEPNWRLDWIFGQKLDERVLDVEFCLESLSIPVNESERKKLHTEVFTCVWHLCCIGVEVVRQSDFPPHGSSSKRGVVMRISQQVILERGSSPVHSQIDSEESRGRRPLRNAKRSADDVFCRRRARESPKAECRGRGVND